METIVRTPQQLGAAIRRRRKLEGQPQGELGAKIGLRQATISKLEAGEPGTRIQTVLDSLAALDLELVVRPRTKGSIADIEEIF